MSVVKLQQFNGQSHAVNQQDGSVDGDQAPFTPHDADYQPQECTQVQ